MGDFSHRSIDQYPPHAHEGGLMQALQYLLRGSAFGAGSGSRRWDCAEASILEHREKIFLTGETNRLNDGPGSEAAELTTLQAQAARVILQVQPFTEPLQGDGATHMHPLVWRSAVAAI